MSLTVSILLLFLGDLLLLAFGLFVCGLVVTRLANSALASLAESYRRAQGFDAVVPQPESEAMSLFDPADSKIKPPWEDWPDVRAPAPDTG